MDTTIVKTVTGATAEVIKTMAPEVYNDVAKPALQSGGQVVGLIPRAVKAALLPLEKWIVEREYSLKTTASLLEKKLENVPPELIAPPEAYIAVPALQYISYCMDNETLRDMYANLLANSMNIVVKSGVHPSFVEIIKQLSPDEAKILEALFEKQRVPMVGVRWKGTEKGAGYSQPLVDFIEIPVEAGCENIDNPRKYLDNLERLGLISRPRGVFIARETAYHSLEKHPLVKKYMDAKTNELDEKIRPEIEKGYVELTAFGNEFHDICCSIPEIRTTTQT